jgi:hypothetical protein
MTERLFPARRGHWARLRKARYLEYRYRQGAAVGRALRDIARRVTSNSAIGEGRTWFYRVNNGRFQHNSGRGLVANAKP